jgi:hypothetical protein
MAKRMHERLRREYRQCQGDHIAEDDHDFEECIGSEPETTGIRIEEVQDLLDDMESHRRALATDAGVLAGWLRDSEEFAAAWNKFIASGGVTADDFRDFIKGRLRRARPLRQRRHLRLVASKDKTTLIRRRLSNGNDAA